VNGRIEVNGRRAAEPYLPGGGAGRLFDFLPFTVPAGSYFVMGDNRSGSNDSRIFGPVRREDIIGRAMIRIWPFSRLGSL
ncbi:MAG: signal peptidase I, partial [Actinomycetota bacterium]